MRDPENPIHRNGLEVAIIGMVGRFPQARNLDTFWELLRSGKEGITFFTRQELEAGGVDPAILNLPNYVSASGALEEIELFDAPFFGYSPREAEVMDPQQRVFLESAFEALENAGYNPETYRGLIGVYAGVGVNAYLQYLYSNRDLMASVGGLQANLGNDKDYLTTRVSYKLGLKGPSVTVQTACSTSLVAVQLAHQSLLCGACDIALAGGVSIRVPQRAGYFSHEGGIMSPDGHCRAFDARAQGTVGGNGLGIVVLKRLEEALEDGDFIHAVIKGSAINNDGSSKVGYTAPSVEGQARVIRTAHAMADVKPETITYVETHGSGTPLGDPIEVSALTAAFGGKATKKKSCAIGSVKTNIGHLDTAAGAASLIKTVLALEQKQIPASLHFESPNPNIDFSSGPFFVNTTLTEWERGPVARRAGVSAFGLGGTNAHVVLEEAPDVETSSESRPWQLLVLSAKTYSALEKTTENLAAHLKQHPNEKIADVAFTLQVGRGSYGHRRTVICQSAVDAARALETRDPARVFTSIQEVQFRPIAFMFPGLGDHYVDMALGLYLDEPVFREHVDHCAEFLLQYINLDLRDVLYPRRGSAGREDSTPGGQEVRRDLNLRMMLQRDAQKEDEFSDALNQTALAQPALFVVEYALSRLWMSWGISPQAMIGYSIGEYVAACLAGVISLEDALFLVARRAQMIQMLEKGAMLAVPLSEEELKPLLGKNLSLSAVNGPSLCVISGPRTDIEEFRHRSAERGMACRSLKTGHAFHSGMMRPIIDSFAEVIGRLKLGPPQIPYISNVTGTWITADQATDPEYWVRHLCEAVRFGDGVVELWKTDGRILMEVGPGQTLSSLAMLHPASNEAAGHLALSSICHSYERRSDTASLLTTLGKLWLAGVTPDWPGYYAAQRRRRLPLPTYPFERQRYWIEPRRATTGLNYQPPNELPSKPLQNVSEAGEAKMDGEGSSHELPPLRKKEYLKDWFYIPTWKQVPSPVSVSPDRPSQEPCCWLIFMDKCGIGARLVSCLERDGNSVVTVTAGDRFSTESDDVFTINPKLRDDYDSLLKELQRSGKSPKKIMHLWSITPADYEPTDSAFIEKGQDLGFYSLFFLAQAIGEQDMASAEEIKDVSDSLQIAIVSNNMQLVGGEEITHPQKATILGPCLVIPLEYPNVSCRSIDIVIPESRTRLEELVEQLIAEFTVMTSDAVVAFRYPHRWVQRFEPLQLGEPALRPPRLRESGVYLITGGLGGIGLSVAEFLARSVRAKMILITRSTTPDRDDWDEWLATHDEQDETTRSIRRLQKIEELGGELLVLSADVADKPQLMSAIQRGTARFGQINGVIHAAGIPPKHIIQRRTQEMAARVLLPKVNGTVLIGELFKGSKLDFLVLCSSLRSIMGGHGTVDYSAANAFLDAYARSYNSRNGTVTTSIIWDAWREVGMAVKGTQRILPEEGLGAGISTEEGIEAFSRILSTALPQVVVSMHDLHLLSRYNSAYARATALRHLFTPRHPRPELATPYVAPRTEAEQTLADIWQELLGIDEVGVNDSFFELGGDSVLSIRLVSRANQAGLNLTPKQVFQTHTIAELAEVAKTGLVILAEQGLVTGPVPLTPIQRWFFELELLDSHHWNQSLLQEVRVEFDPALLPVALQHLLEHHDVLRHRYIVRENGWAQIAEGVGEAVAFTHLDLSSEPEERQTSAIEAAAAKMQTGLNLSEGPMLRIGYFDLGKQRPGRLLIVVHHLLIDILSWRILLEDLHVAWQHLSRGEPVQLPRKTTSFKEWSEKLTELAQTPTVRSELSYWLREGRSDPPPLPRDYPGADNTVGSSDTLSVSLDVEETRVLLQETQADDALLTALTQAFSEWTGSSSLLVNMEGHGRDPLFDDVDTSRTVGWFTTFFPLLLEIPESADIGEALISVRDRLREVPNRGYGYGLLRFLIPDKEIAERFTTSAEAEVSFVYLGQSNQRRSGFSAFASAAESGGPKRSQRASRQHVFEISANTSEGQLRVNWSYSRNLHRRTTVERLSRDFLLALRSLIGHCQSADSIAPKTLEFPLTGLSIDELATAFQRVEFEEK